jgi:predicted HAD superfamily hydrolase
MFKPSSKDFSNIFSSWEPDEIFVKNALIAAKAAQVVSFDIFDTALTRSFDSPIDIFSAIEALLLKNFGREARGFARSREQAEALARKNLWDRRRLQEIKLVDIYRELQHLYPFSQNIPDLMEIELKVEDESLHAVPDIINLYKQLKKIGKTIIFTSDMYLPKDYLCEVLLKNGYYGFDNLFVSSEITKTKAAGDIWEYIQHQYPGSKYNGKILHIGDDIHSDVEGPKKHKVTTLYYSRAKSSRRTGGKPGQGLASASKWFRFASLNNRKLLFNTKEQEQCARNLGFHLGGPVIGGFLQWLIERLEHSKPDRIYFLARDGYLLHDLWESTPIANKLKIESKYIFISRAAVNLPGGYLQSTPERLSESLLEFLCSNTGNVTPITALERAGLDKISAILNDATNTFVDLHAKLDSSSDYPKLRALFERHSAAIYEIIKLKHDLAIQYIKQEGLLDPGHFAIIDLGWHASMQANLQQIIKAAGGTATLYGYYYGLWPSAERNRYIAGHLESFFASPQIPIDKQRPVHWGVSFLEQLHGAPYGTTLGYSADASGKILPILQHSPLEVSQHDNITQHFQEGVKEALLYISRHDIHFDRNAAIAAMGSVFLSPLDSELDVFERISHCPTYDHSSHISILDQKIPASIDSLENCLNKSESPALQLRSWLKNANPEQRENILSLASKLFEAFDNRLLRQFK